MKSARDQMDIVDAYATMGSYWGAAARCGTTHKTVKRVVERRAREQVGRRSARPVNTAGVAGLLEERVRQTDGRISAKRLLLVAQAAGYTGSLRNLQRAVQGVKAAWKKARRAYRRWVPTPGEHLVVDWAREGDWELFCAVLAWSRYRFVRPATDQTRETTLRLLAECFGELGGVPAVVLTDRKGCLKARTVANVVVPHPEYVQFATRYGFRPDFCEAADPESKGLVENLVGYAQRDLLAPALLEGGWADLTTATAAAVRWCAAVMLDSGKRRILYGKTREEVAGKLVKALGDLQEGLPLPGQRLTIGKYLERWLEESARPKIKPSTYLSYEVLVRQHLVPGLGRHTLAKLTPQPVQAFLNERAAYGLPPRRVQMMYAVLRVALGRAVKWGLVGRNVALLVDPPRVPRAEIRPLSFAEAQAFLSAAHDHSYELLFTVLLTTGLRIGEALALRWPEVDLEAGRLTVRHTLEQLPRQPWRLAEPKSAAGRRTIPLLPEELSALRAQRKQVIELELRAYGWSSHNLVFPSDIGEPSHVTSVSHAFKKLLPLAGLPTTHRLHDLRHSMATYLLAKGVPHRVVMEMMGHSQISMTMRYQHVLPAMLDEEVARLASVFPTLGRVGSR